MAGDGTRVGSAYVEVSPKMAGNFRSEVEHAMPDGGDGGSRFGSAFSQGMHGAVSAGAVAVGNILSDLVESGAGMAKDLVGSALSGFSDYEQLSGGVEKLFGTTAGSVEEYAQSVGRSVEDAQAEYDSLNRAQEAVMANAADAFESAGMSQNAYMETVTGFSAALISGLEGDTEAAAAVADEAIRDMSDNANTFGTDIGDIQNAYSGFAKQNYTMLDNLKLGYGGTAAEMARLVNDSGVMGDSFEATAKNINDVSYDKIIEAIHAVQTAQHISGLSAEEAAAAVAAGEMTEEQAMQAMGTTAREAATTVEGSYNTMTAAWENWVASLGNDDVSMEEQTQRLVESVGTYLENALPVLEGIFEGISSSLPGLVAQIGPVLVPAVTNMVTSVVPAVLSLAPTLLTAGMQVLLSLVQASAVVLPQVAQVVIAAGPMLKAGAMEFFSGMGQALGEIVPMLVDAVVYVITNLPAIIASGIDLMVEAGASFFGGLIDGITGASSGAEAAASEATEAAAGAALASADASDAGAQLTETMMASFDFGQAEAQATAGMEDVVAAAQAAADGAQVADQLAATTTTGVDVAAMQAPATEMVENAVAAAKAVDASSVGAEFSQKAAGGIDVSAMAGKAAEMAASAAGSLNATSTVSVKADLSGVSQLRAASSAVAASYRAMGSSVQASMRQASSAAASAAASIRRSVSIPNHTVYVNVARGSVQLPHFSMSGRFDAKTNAVPTVNVSWYKDGAIFEPNSPGLIGIGDARVPEVAAPLDALQDMLDMGGGGDTYNVTIQAREGESPEQMADRFLREVKARNRTKGRSAARTRAR